MVLARATDTGFKCLTYSGHLRKVVPLVVKREGRASGH